MTLEELSASKNRLVRKGPYGALETHVQLAQMGGKYTDAKPLKGFGGAGVFEVVEDHDGATYRAVYTVKFAGAIYALHAFQKKSKKATETPKRHLDLIKNGLRPAAEFYREWPRAGQTK